MNPFLVASSRVSTLTIPLKAPFVTALGRKTGTTNAFIELRLRDGAAGWGEASSSVVMSHLSPGRLAASLRRLARSVVGKDVRRAAALAEAGWKAEGRVPAAAAAFESALLDALLGSLGVSMHEWFGGARRSLAGGITISASGPTAAARAASLAAGEGFEDLKVKIGTGPKPDLERVLSVDRAGRRAGRRPRIVLDGNQGMTRAGTLELLDRLFAKGVRVALLEQPLPADAVAEAALLRRDCPVPLAADESLRSVADARRLLDADAADVLNVKLAKTGLSAALDIIALARSAGKKLMIGCMQESALGLSPSVHLAAGSGAFSFVDLDSDHLLGAGQPAGRFTRRGPRLTVAE